MPALGDDGQVRSGGVTVDSVAGFAALLCALDDDTGSGSRFLENAGRYSASICRVIVRFETTKAV